MEKKLTHEQIEKLKACKTSEEANELAEKENIELTDEGLEAIAGGKKAVTVFSDAYGCFHKWTCPNCKREFDYESHFKKHLMSCSKK